MFDIERLKDADATTAKQINSLTSQLGLTGVAPKPISQEDLAEMLGQSNLHCLVVRDRDRIVGLMVLYLTRIPTGLIAEAEDLVVDEDYRKWGVGPMLVQKAIEISETSGAKHISLRTNPKRVEANKMYQALGFHTKESVFYRINLPRKPGV